MTNIIVSVQNTAEKFIGSLDLIDFTAIEEIVNELSGEELSPKEITHSKEAISKWSSSTIERIQTKMKMVELLRSFKATRNTCFLLPTYESVYVYSQVPQSEVINFISELASDVGLSDQFKDLYAFATHVYDSIVFEPFDDEVGMNAKALREKERTKYARLARKLLKQELAFKDTLCSHPDVMQMYAKFEKILPNLRKSISSVEELARVAEISLTATSKESKDALIKLYKEMVK